MFILLGGKKWEFEFEQLVDLQIAFASVGQVLGSAVETEIGWNDRKKRFDKTRRQPIPRQPT